MCRRNRGYTTGIDLRTKTEEDRTIYKNKCAITKEKIRKVHKTSWEKYISDIEHDVHGRQINTYKIIKHLNRTERDTAQLNIIEKEEWKKHYKQLWLNPHMQNNAEREHPEENKYIDPSTIEELNKTIKIQKSHRNGLHKYRTY